MSFFLNFLLIAVGLAVAVAQFNATTTCVCTTVPCPIAGSNALTEGTLENTLNKFHGIIINFEFFFSQAAELRQLTIMFRTTILLLCHLPVWPFPWLILIRVPRQPLVPNHILALWMMMEFKTAMPVTFWLIVWVALETNQLTFSLRYQIWNCGDKSRWKLFNFSLYHPFIRILLSTAVLMLNMKERFMTASRLMVLRLRHCHGHLLTALPLVLNLIPSPTRLFSMVELVDLSLRHSLTENKWRE